MIKNIVVGFMLLVLGSLLGWWVRGLNELTHVQPATFEVAGAADRKPVKDADLSANQLLNGLFADLGNQSPLRKVELLQAHLLAQGDEFRVLIRLSDELRITGQFELAKDALLRASLVARTLEQQDFFEVKLAKLVDEYSRELISLSQFENVDVLYESLTLALPQLAQYYLQLGQLRIRMGNLNAALVPLAQISNHSQLGVEARRLMDQIEDSIDPVVTTSEELPLIAASGQFLVDAVIDNKLSIRVLIDTGAAMTVLKSSVLQMLGYNLSGRKEYFVTAGGVVEAPVVIIDSLSLGNASLQKLTVGALDLKLSGQVDGLLGMNFLRRYDFRIDQNRGVLILDKR